MQKTDLKTIVERNDEKHFLFPQKKLYNAIQLLLSIYPCLNVSLSILAWLQGYNPIYEQISRVVRQFFTKLAFLKEIQLAQGCKCKKSLADIKLVPAYFLSRQLVALNDSQPNALSPAID